MKRRKRRTSVSQKLRFEVLKRDDFTCQYCGRKAPEVTLEVDHVDPVARGGVGDVLNLVSSCRDCNGGKGARVISDQSVIAAQVKEVERRDEKLREIERLAKLSRETESFHEQEHARVIGHWLELSEWCCRLTEEAKDRLRRELKK